MRVRMLIASACLLWIAAESRFSPSFFWSTVTGSVQNLTDSLDTARLDVDERRANPGQLAAKLHD